MAVLALVIGIGGSWAIGELVEAVNDRILGAASHAIADSLTIQEGKVGLSLSPAIFGMLENNERDNVYYSVRHHGQLLTGYPDLPSIAPANLSDGEVRFGKGAFRGRPVRIVAEARSVGEAPAPVIIEVAETLDARQRISDRMLLVLAGIEITMIVVVMALLPFAVRWGLKPLDTVCDELDVRAATDLAALDTASVPRELHKLVDAFNRMLGRLDAAIEGMRRFTADASHQMRTPLAILRTHIGLLRSVDRESPEFEVALADIDDASRRLGHLLVQLLALARADAASPQAIALAAIDLNEVASSVSAEVAADAVGAGIDFHFEPSGRRALVVGHPELARELLANLMDNAVRYNRSGGSVHVSVCQLEDGAAVIIEDDGPGILPADRDKVFTRFTRLARNQQIPGSGLGMPIALSLAKAIRASIELATPLSGSGLKVIVRFSRT